MLRYGGQAMAKPELERSNNRLDLTLHPKTWFSFNHTRDYAVPSSDHYQVRSKASVSAFMRCA